MRRLSHEIEIEATPARVWQVLADFDAYPEWNPFVRRIEGTPAPGERLKVLIGPPGGRPMTFRPTVLAAEPERELRWLGRLGLPGIFDGEHSFTIEPAGEGRVRFTQAESFRGLLVPLLGRMLARTEQGFAAMDEALKRRAEG